MKIKTVFLISKPTLQRQHFISSLESAGAQVQNVEKISDAHKLMSESVPDVLVHILQDYEREEVGIFHHRLVRSDVGKSVHRFIVHRGENRRALAFASDCGMRRAIQSDLAAQSLSASLELSQNVFAQMSPELQQAIRLVCSGDCFLTDEQREFVETLSRQYENVLCLQLAQARFELLRGQFKPVVEIARRTLKDEPYNTRALGCLGEALFHTGQLSESFRILCAAEGLAAGNPLRLAVLGRLFLRMQDRKNALKCLMKSARICPVTPALQPLVEELKMTADERIEFLAAVEQSGCSETTIEDLKRAV